MGMQQISGVAIRLFVALAVAVGLTLPLLDARPAAAAGTCLGSAIRQITYTSDGVIHLKGCDQVFTLTDVASASVVGPGKLELVDPINKIWYLKVNLLVEEGATLRIVGGPSGDANWLRLRSDSTGHVWLRTANGNLLLQDTKVTSWNASTNTYDTDYTTMGRAYIAARSIWTQGRETTPPTPCSVNGGSQEYYEARLDIINSELAYLGYSGSEAYGVVWKVYSKTPPPGRQLYEMVDIFGTVTGSWFHHNYFGAYTYGGYCMTFRDNVFEHNVQYGLDPHDDSDYLTIDNNISRFNGNHGIICSIYCDHIVITNNETYGNAGNGIMIHRRVDGAIIEGNNSYDNNDSGIAIFDSHDSVIRSNTLSNNGKAAIRLSVGASGNLIENNVMVGRAANQSGSGYVVYTYKGSDAPTEPGDGRPKNNILRNNQITGYKSLILKINDGTANRFENNTIDGSGTAFEFRNGVDNVVEGNQFGPGVSSHISTTGSSTLPATTFVRNSQVGATLTLRLGSYSTTTLEDSEYHVWLLPETGLPTLARPGGTSLSLTPSNAGSRELVTTLDFVVHPLDGEISVQPTLWETSAPYRKGWSESSTTAMNPVAHRVGNLEAGACYEVTASGSSIGLFTADSNGRISFVYSSGYATEPVSFTVEPATGCGEAIDTTITSGPSGTVTSNSATFTYSSNVSGASFQCRLDGESFSPCPATGQSYTDLADGTHTFEVRAVAPGGAIDPSPASRTWTIDATPPDVTADPAGGVYTSPVLVTLSASEPATIYYTIDGTDPTLSSSVYNEPVAISENTTLKFFAVDAAGTQSIIVTEIYTFETDTTPPVVTADPPGGDYSSPQGVRLTASEPATIYYTTDGSEPTVQSAVYSGPITVSADTTLKFFAVDTAGNASDVVTEIYTFSFSFSDGFETGDLSRWSYGNGLVVQAGDTHSGSYAARATSTSGTLAYARLNLPVAQDELYYQTSFKLISQGNNSVTLLRLRQADGQTMIVTVYVTAKGKLAIRNDVAGVSTTTSTTVEPGIWHDVKLHVVINGNQSLLEVWYNGTLLVSQTASLGTNLIGQAQLGESASNRIYDVIFDDVSIGTAQ